MAMTTERARAAAQHTPALNRRLFEQVEHLENRILLARETTLLVRKQLEEKRQAKIAALDNRLRRTLYPKELALSAPEDAAREQLRTLMPRLEKEQRLAYRKTQQELRRAEGLLDKAGRLLPGKALSETSQTRLNYMHSEQEKERRALEEKTLAEARSNRLPEAKLASLKAGYEQAMAAKADRLNTLDKQLRTAYGEHAEKTAHKQEAVTQKLEKKLQGKKKLLLDSEKARGQQLPDDLCLRLDRLSMAFGGLKAVDDLSFDVKKGEIFGLIGPNGAGKTTVFNCITQFYKPTGGYIIYRTHEGNVLQLNDYQVHNIISKGIVRTFQNVEVIGELSILDNLLIAAHKQYSSGLFSQMFNTRRVRQEELVIRERAMKVLDYCGLAHLKDLSPLGQPYGILKRIELARTLMARANLIILDEPAAGLNDQETVELTRMIRQIREDFNVTIFVIEHNMGLIMDICDHICAISFGKKLAYGTPREIQNDPLVQEAYLGTNDVAETEAR